MKKNENKLFSSSSCEHLVSKELKSILQIKSTDKKSNKSNRKIEDITNGQNTHKNVTLNDNKKSKVYDKLKNANIFTHSNLNVSDLSLETVKQSETRRQKGKCNKNYSMESNQKGFEQLQTNLENRNLQNKHSNNKTNLENKSDCSTINSSCAYVDENFFFDGKKVGKYLITKSLGSGSFSSVKQGVNMLSGETVAIKIVKREVEDGEKKEERVYREVLISSLLCHPHIVRLKNFYFNEGFFFLIFEYVNGSMLLDVILEEGPLPENVARRYFRQLLSAIGYIHENNIVHRDLKIENILIDENGNIKLVDFGLSNFYDNRRFLETCCGSLYFAAPELLIGKKYIGPEIDVWSLGIILYVLLCGCVPFDDRNMQKLHQKIKKAKLTYTKTLSNNVVSLLEKMICNDMTKRLSLEEVIDDKWINEGYTNKIDIYLEKRAPLTEVDKRLVFVLNSITNKQFPTLQKDIRQYAKACKDNENYAKNLLYKKPTISLYYLIQENFLSSNENIDKGYQNVFETSKEEFVDMKSEDMHNFVNFIFSKDKQNMFSQYFSGSIFNEKEDVQNDDMSLRDEFYSKSDLKEIKSNTNIPKIKKSFVKGFIGGILLKNLSCQEKIRILIQTFLITKKIEYEILDRHYMCNFAKNDSKCNFKISLFFNVIIGSYFVSLKKIDGDIETFKNIRKMVNDYLQQSSATTLDQSTQ
ncbi:Serine/threonine-protein kinase [Binucleata daphniae]